MLLKPRSPLGLECRNLALDITNSVPNQYFVCQDQNCSKTHEEWNVSMYSDIASCSCGKSLNREIRIWESRDGGVFIIDPLSFIITDDLCISPMDGIIQTLSSFGITDTQCAEMEIVSFGINEIRDLLKFSLTSATPLTDTIIKKSDQIMSSTAARPEHEILLHHHIQKDDANPRKMVLKVCLQRSTNRFLFAVATDEFVELLFSFLTVPLGGVEFLLGGKTGLDSLDNLYRSISNGIDDEYFTTPETKSKLINPKLPHGYISKNQFLPLSEEAPPKLYYQLKFPTYPECKDVSFHEKHGTLVDSVKMNKELFVKKRTFYIVTDDLTVTPSLATSISMLNGLGIPLSDVKEMQMDVGLEEALRILKASLISKTAFTDALIKPLLKLERQFKQEP